MSQIPHDVRVMISDGERYSVEEWRAITRDWDDVPKKIATIFRSVNRGRRVQHVLENDELKELFESDDCMRSVIALCHLSDEALERLVTSFTH